jgi:murein DD-endopeptidase MepM/ murein hydrolase activator NlpD
MSMRRVLLVAVLAALLVAPVARAWTWPVGGPVLQPFSFDPAHPYAAGEHRGIDIAATAEEEVLAPAAGTVTFSGTVPGSGRALTITTDDGFAVTLTHLGSIEIGTGATVAEGQAVGAVGPSGDAEVDGPYLHLGIRVAVEAQG